MSADAERLDKALESCPRAPRAVIDAALAAATGETELVREILGDQLREKDEIIVALQHDKRLLEHSRQKLGALLRASTRARRKSREALAAATAENEKLLGLDTSHPLVDVLTKLREAAEILLHDKSYDDHGWELIAAAHAATDRYIALASRVPQPAEADALPDRPERIEEPMPEDLERVLRNPEIAFEADWNVHRLLREHARRNPEARITRASYLNLWALIDLLAGKP